MEKHLELSDEQFLNQFINCELDPSIFSHEAHLRLAWINIQKYGIELAVEHVTTQLLSFVNSLGEPSKYNKTLTVTAVEIVHHFMQQSDTTSFYDFILEFPRLKSNFKELIESHYSFDIFESTRAKKEYLAPDLLPFS